MVEVEEETRTLSMLVSQEGRRKTINKKTEDCHFLRLLERKGSERRIVLRSPSKSWMALPWMGVVVKGLTPMMTAVPFLTNCGLLRLFHNDSYKRASKTKSPPSDYLGRDIQTKKGPRFWRERWMSILLLVGYYYSNFLLSWRLYPFLALLAFLMLK